MTYASSTTSLADDDDGRRRRYGINSFGAFSPNRHEEARAGLPAARADISRSASSWSAHMFHDGRHGADLLMPRKSLISSKRASMKAEHIGRKCLFAGTPPHGHVQQMMMTMRDDSYNARDISDLFSIIVPPPFR